jgi:hypothetical protein
MAFDSSQEIANSIDLSSNYVGDLKARSTTIIIS